MKFIGLYGTVGFNAIRDFSLWGESDLWSDVWLAMDVVVCLSILLEGGVTVSNNFTKRSQNGFKIGTRDKFATHLRKENFISIEIVIYTIFLRWLIFPYNSLYTQAVAYTTYFELGEPVFGMVPRPFAPARAIKSRTCADVIQPCYPGVQIPYSARELLILSIAWHWKRDPRLILGDWRLETWYRHHAS